jgi:hypothetical protein
MILIKYVLRLNAEDIAVSAATCAFLLCTAPFEAYCFCKRKEEATTSAFFFALHPWKFSLATPHATISLFGSRFSLSLPNREQDATTHLVSQ